MQEKVGLPQGRFVNYSKAGATHGETRRMTQIRPASIHMDFRRRDQHDPPRCATSFRPCAACAAVEVIALGVVFDVDQRHPMIDQTRKSDRPGFETWPARLSLFVYRVCQWR